MGTTKDVKDRLPGLQFRVEAATQGKKTASGTQHGIITLRCEYRDVTLFEAAVEKLNGFKLFGELAQEIVDALGSELDETDSSRKAALREVERLTAEGKEKDAEITRLRALLDVIEVELGDPPAAFFSDDD